MEEVVSEKIRNICILAHVDHGKTTLADHLIASSGGGVLHPRQAGTARIMDYLDEERRRAITMKSSSIGLHYRGYSINLIDSPGHMDFCSEVSTAARLSDGALVLVDAVEGVHMQTHVVLRQAWVEKVTPCLVLNKIDRLITKLNYTPMEAYIQLLKIIQEVNGIVSAYKSEKYLSDVDSSLAAPPVSVDDEEDTFQPQKGNFAFVCALDGWGFCLDKFAELYAMKFGASAAAFRRSLWGPHHFNRKKRKVVRLKTMDGSGEDLPMFVDFILMPIWQVYKAALDPNGSRSTLEKVVMSFMLPVSAGELQNRDPKVALQAVMSRWLPLSESVLSMVIRCTPDPVRALSIRVDRLIPKRDVVSDRSSSDVIVETDRVRTCVQTCNSSPEAPCIAFVSKMFAVPVKLLPHGGPNGEVIKNFGEDSGVSKSGECFLAFARIFSGILFAGQKIYVLTALYDPLKAEAMQKHLQEAEVHSLYLMMGQDLTPVASAKAGNVVAIRGLGQHILKSATLSSTKNCWPFSSMVFQVAPTLRVAIEPSDPADMGALMKGLKLLNQADPFVEVNVSATGEQLLGAAGEVHLERCIKDLEERFAKVKLEVSPPLVSYRESIEEDSYHPVEMTGISDCVVKITPNKRCRICVRVMKIPPGLTKVIDESSDLLAAIIDGKCGYKGKSGLVDENPAQVLKKRMVDAIENEFKSDRIEVDREKYKNIWLQYLLKIWALGPRQVGPNILLVPDTKVKGDGDDVSVLIRGNPHISERLGFVDVHVEENDEDALHIEAKSLRNSLVSGFQLATAAGPLCDEPMWGLVFLVEARMYDLQSNPVESEPSTLHQDQHGIFTGQIMTAVKEACRAAMLQKKPRLVEGFYFCELNTPAEYLGAMFAVLRRRRARVLEEVMVEGSSLFKVLAYVPVAESFGFADELRRGTSGACSALLWFSHWEALPADPFFVPKTEEEIEEYGDGSSVLPNTARKLINAVRRRKGISVEEKLVQHGQKQRTLARKV